mmetsp:Transcript_917/g.1290  ORF Transcript_917/g.1290 Transcript_917/m.1290 type:complete len:291 (+) Transcript_917:87-959(+)
MLTNIDSKLKSRVQVTDENKTCEESETSDSENSCIGEESSYLDEIKEKENSYICDSVLRYEKICRIGEGTYGVVYKARDRRTGQIVALKAIREDHHHRLGGGNGGDGGNTGSDDDLSLPVTCIREIRILQECVHRNIVRLLRVATGEKSVFLVFEYCDHDLGHILDSFSDRKSRIQNPRHPLAPSTSTTSPGGGRKVQGRSPFNIAEAKTLIRQLLEAVACLHGRWVVHRDIKLPNLLYSSSYGTLKLCDFGLARHFSPFVSAAAAAAATPVRALSPSVLGSCDVDGAFS